jgi:hypothetical protein
VFSVHRNIFLLFERMETRQCVEFAGDSGLMMLVGSGLAAIDTEI